MTTGSALEREIREQPRVLAERTALAAAASREVGRLLRSDEVTHVVIAARGSSDNAARYGQYLFGGALRLGTYLGTPSLFQTERAPRLRGALVLGISQSGQSPDVVRVLDEAHTQGRPTIAITNDLGSPLARSADVCVPLAAGDEDAVAATKTFTATLHALVQIAIAAGARGMSGEFARLPDMLQRVVESVLDAPGPLLPGWDRAATRESGLTAIGRGTGYASAAETALKIREVGRVRAESYPVPDLLHGPIAGNRAGTTAWLVASPGFSQAYWTDVADRLLAEGVRIAAVAPTSFGTVPAQMLHPLPDDLSSWAFDLVAVCVGQVAALRTGQAAGLDVDHPHGLAKVTLTR